MAFITIDDYYDTNFYNETKEALKNNKVPFKEFISSRAPYNFYLQTDDEPKFINYDKSNKSYSRWLVNVIRPLRPNDAYIYERRDTYTNIKAIKHYAINDALQTGQDSGQGVFFTANKEEILRITKDYPRKVYFMGRYFNRRYKVFFADSLMIKNFIDTRDVLVESSSFKLITELEVELNYNIFKEKDRLEKLSETPYVQDGKYYPVKSTVPEISDMYVLT